MFKRHLTSTETRRMLSGRCGTTDSRIVDSAEMTVSDTRNKAASASQKKLSGTSNLWMKRPTQALYHGGNGAADEEPIFMPSLLPNKTRNSATLATLKMCSRASGIWMKRPTQESQLNTCDSDSDADQDKPKFESSHCEESSWTPTEMKCRAKAHTRPDLQTNNSKKVHPSATGTSDSSHDSSSGSVPICSPSSSNLTGSDYEVVSEFSDAYSQANTSAVAKGADAMVKNSLSRPTEIIDTSKLVEEGRVSTGYLDEEEIYEEQDPQMIEEYEKNFAYARRLRQLLNMKFKELDRSGIETNFQLVKAHEHPTQRMIDRWRNVDYGISYNDQVLRQKQIDDYRNIKKTDKKGMVAEPIYPDLIRFSVRFRKDNSEKRWTDFIAFRQKQKPSNNKGLGPVPKLSDKYLFAFQDVWSYNVVVFVKPGASLREIVDPVFARLGLERRADFVYTIGCFKYDKRTGKAKIPGVPSVPEPVELYKTASELYRSNCTEIYVNDNRCEMFTLFPSYYNKNLADNEEPETEKKKEIVEDEEEKDKKAKSELDANANNNNEFDPSKDESVASMSNLASASCFLLEEADAFEALASATAPFRSKTRTRAAPITSSSTSLLSIPGTSVPECH